MQFEERFVSGHAFRYAATSARDVRFSGCGADGSQRLKEAGAPVFDLPESKNTRGPPSFAQLSEEPALSAIEGVGTTDTLLNEFLSRRDRMFRQHRTRPCKERKDGPRSA